MDTTTHQANTFTLETGEQRELDFSRPVQPLRPPVRTWRRIDLPALKLGEEGFKTCSCGRVLLSPREEKFALCDSCEDLFCS